MDIGLLITGVPLVVLSRAVNIYPLAYLVNRGEPLKITCGKWERGRVGRGGGGEEGASATVGEHGRVGRGGEAKRGRQLQWGSVCVCCSAAMACWTYAECKYTSSFA